MGKEMIQWASGTKPERFNRVHNDSAYWENMAAIKRNEKRGVPKPPLALSLWEKGDLITNGDVIRLAGEINHERDTVLIGSGWESRGLWTALPPWVALNTATYMRTYKQPGAWFGVHRVPLDFEAHPNAEHLVVLRPFGYTVVARRDELGGDDFGYFIPADAALNGRYWRDKGWTAKDCKRVRIRKFRGVKSYGIIIPESDVPRSIFFPPADHAKRVGAAYYKGVESWS